MVPFVRASTLTECGPAALAMVLAFHGREAPLEAISALLDPAQGTSARALLTAARALGLDGFGARVERPEQLAEATILHWDGNHFVVFEKSDGETLSIVDPSVGRRTVPREEFERRFSGVALFFEPAEGAVAPAGAPGPRLGGNARLRLRRLAPALVATAMGQVGALALPLLAAAALDRRAPVSSLAVVGAAAVLAHGLVRLGRSRALLRLHRELGEAASRDLLLGMLQQPLRWFQQVAAGPLMERLLALGAVRDALDLATACALLDGGAAVVQWALLASVSPLLALIVLATAALQLGAAFAQRQRLDAEADELTLLDGAVRKTAYEAFRAIEGVKASREEGQVARAVAARLAESEQARTLSRRRIAALDATVEALALAGPCAVLLVGVWRAEAAGLGPGMLAAAVLLAAGVGRAAREAIDAAVRLRLARPYWRSLQSALPSSSSARPPSAARSDFSGPVTIERVSFTYSPLSPRGLHDITLELRPGQLVALVGPPASGKTTLLRLVAGLYTPTAGRILAPDSIGWVPQRPSFPAGTVGEAISGDDPEVAFEEVVAAAKRARIHDAVMAMPMQYQTLVLADGGTLSDSERRRIALAHALVRRAKLLLLDETTDGLDPSLAQAIHSELAELGVTRLAVTSRWATASRAAWIYVLEEGRIVDQGAPRELAARAGPFASLFADQLPGGPR